MSGPRALANHARYMAELQLDAWRALQVDNERPAWVLAAAFVPAVQLHLRQAYGWLLLAAARVTQVPAEPPGRVAELPGLAQGLALPVEVSACRELEQSGWLAELLRPLPATPPMQRTALLATSGGGYPALADCEEWLAAMDALIEAVDHAIDES